MADMDIAPIEAALVTGDLSKLTDQQRVQYYLARCEAAGLDPRSKPFDYITLNSRLTLYAGAGAADQIAAHRHLNVDVLSREMTEGDIYEVLCRVRDPNGRTTDNISALYVGGLKGEALANARMKAVTKARRRTILAHCGLGMLDETETETIPGAARVRVNEHGEVMGELPAPPDDDSKEARDAASRRVYAIAKEKGVDTTPEAGAIRLYASKALKREVPLFRELTAQERHRVGDYLETLEEPPGGHEPAESELDAWRASQAADAEPAQMRGA